MKTVLPTWNSEARREEATFPSMCSKYLARVSKYLARVSKHLAWRPARTQREHARGQAGRGAEVQGGRAAPVVAVVGEGLDLLLGRLALHLARHLLVPPG